MTSLLLAVARRCRTAIALARFSKIRYEGVGLHIGSGCRFWAPECIEIGNNVYLGREVTIECNAYIGNGVLIANQVALVGRNDHDFRVIGVPVRFAPWVGGESHPDKRHLVTVEDDVWIGYGAIILSGVVVGRGAIVAAGSVVTKNVPPYEIWGGNPARRIGDRFPSSVIDAHERSVAEGVFVFSERGYSHWVVKPT